MMKSLMRRLGAALALPLLVAAAPVRQAAQPAAAHPALWEVSDPDTTIYLFGTIHLLPDDYQWRSPRFDKAVAGSNELVVETIIDEKNPTQLMSVLASMAFSPGLPPLADRLPPAQRPALAAAIAKSGIPPAALDRMETWAAAFLLLGNQFRDMGLKSGEGVEAVLRQAFTQQKKPIGELETNAQQLGFFDRLPEKAQRALLQGAIEAPQDTSKEFGQMLSAWARGDVPEIAKTFNHDLSGSPELKQALITQRNANWVSWIEQRMAQPGTIMIAVGAGHLAGRDSVVDQLQRAGYRVSRVQ